MSRTLAYTIFLSLAIFCAGSAFAGNDNRKLCGHMPENADFASVTATDDERQPSYIHVGDTASYLKGRNNVYVVNQHNGQPIVISESCEN